MVDPSHPDHDPAYARVLAPTEDEPPPDPAANPHRALLKLARECEHAGPWIGDCACTRRCAIYTRNVAISDCLACLKADGLDE